MPLTPPTDAPRLLVVLPSWVGDAVMATPALARLRAARPGAFIGALARPGIDRLLEGLTDASDRPVFDEITIDRPTGVLGPKRTAARLRPRRYAAAILLTGSFSTALIARIAGIPRRVGYDRDGRGPLLTRRLRPPRTAGRFAIVPAVDYYAFAVAAALDDHHPTDLDAPALARGDRVDLGPAAGERLRLAVSDRDHREAADTLARAAVDRAEPFAILNPGGNKPEKRWPADRFADVGRHLAADHRLRVLVSGAPAEADLCRDIAARIGPAAASLPDAGVTLGALKALCASPAGRLMITNDTGPRHIAAALALPAVSLFGPTDPRWTTIPVAILPDGRPSETILSADPTLPPDQSANDHPHRCRIEHITVEAVRDAADALLVSPRPG